MVQGLVCKGKVMWFEVRACHKVGSKKEKTAAELMELCGNLPNQAWICGRCLELNCD